MRDYMVYAIIETAFVKTDPRFRSLPPLARWLYLCLWVDGFHHRREQLPHWYDTRAMQDTSGMDTRSVRKYVAILQQKCLISISEDGRITVCGIKGKGNVRWKEDGAEPSPRPSPKPSVLKTGSRVEESRVEERTTDASEPAKHPAGPAPISGDEFKTAWNAQVANVPKCRDWTKARAAKLKARCADAFWLARWREAMSKIGTSAFLQGGSKGGWRADIDWFLQPDSVTKILEGKYDGPGADAGIYGFDGTMAELEGIGVANFDAFEAALKKEHADAATT
jgi:hypothetical protein